MPDAAAPSQARLRSVLSSLRSVLSSGPKQQIPMPLRFMAHGAKVPNGVLIDIWKYPRIIDVVRAVGNARKETFRARTSRTISAGAAAKILAFLHDDVGILDELPADQDTLETLDKLLAPMGKPRETWNKGKQTPTVKKIEAFLKKGRAPSDIVVEMKAIGQTVNERQISNIKSRAVKAKRLET